MTAPKFGRVAQTMAQKCLDAFGRDTPGLVSAVLLSADGFEVASLRLNEGGAARLAAMGSSLAAVGSAIAQEAGLAGCDRLLVESATGTVLVLNVPHTKPALCLAIVAEKTVVLGQLLWSANGCVAAVGRAFRE